ncbi:MAG TPA: pantoate--beta-alanine ligase [Saprospiraceae bacterium]|nr:pantoate--beta-alanine ligase [Saprospiraceae bacterium]
MQLSTKVSTLQTYLRQQRVLRKRVAFIPTMGALHEGHLSLVDIGQQKADITVVSIFVNPTQFNNPDDLLKYPRMLEKDAWMLENRNTDILFAPVPEEIYPPGLETQVELDLQGLDEVMEGEFRPGHFKGMLQVVKRLLDIVGPDSLVMGQKDFQQFTLVRHMIQSLKLPVQLIIGPTLREPDGLAMSSRNMRLTPEFRKIAPVLYQVLTQLRKDLDSGSLDTAVQTGLMRIENSGLRPEYLSVVDAFSLKKVITPGKHSHLVACVAAWAGDIRLIDNLMLKGSLD